MGRKLKGFMPITVFFLLLNAFFIAGQNMLDQWETDRDVLIIGNTIIFLITLISFVMLRRSIDHLNPHVFVRSVFGSFMIKLFVCVIAVFTYVSQNGKGLNKPALFNCMGLYLVYTAMEVAVLMKLLRRKTNG